MSTRTSTTSSRWAVRMAQAPELRHQLVRWRSVGEFSAPRPSFRGRFQGDLAQSEADIWLSCYTKPSIEGIRLKSYTATQQSAAQSMSFTIAIGHASFI